MKKIISIIIVFIMLFNIIYYIYIPNQSLAALSSSYTQTLKVGIDQFPESYKPYLQKLQEMHPNWNFKAYYTGIDWNELTSSKAENSCGKNTIKKIGLMDPTMLCICGKIGDPGYYCASAKTVNYYLDPRNFLIESSVFQFLDLSNSVSLSKGTIAEIVKGTYLSNYVDTIIEAANQSGVNPLHIIVTIYQELGNTSETPKAISYEELDKFLHTLATDESLGIIIRSKGILKASDNNKWYYYDFVSGDYEIRLGNPDYTGRIVVIGSKMDEKKIENLFFNKGE